MAGDRRDSDKVWYWALVQVTFPRRLGETVQTCKTLPGIFAQNEIQWHDYGMHRIGLAPEVSLRMVIHRGGKRNGVCRPGIRAQSMAEGLTTSVPGMWTSQKPLYAKGPGARRTVLIFLLAKVLVL